MLANGIKLGYKETAEAAEFTDLTGLKEVPELGSDPEKVDNTDLAADVKQYEMGIGDAGDMEYKFKYVNTTNSSYRKLRAAADSKKVYPFQQTMPDGTKYQFDAQVNVKVGGGGVNAAVEFTAAMALQSKITVVDPTE